MAAALSNRLLNSLSPESRKALEEKLVVAPLPITTPIFESTVTPKYTYFITSGIASVVTDMAEGSAVEVGLLGRESVAGSLVKTGLANSFNGKAEPRSYEYLGRMVPPLAYTARVCWPRTCLFIRELTLWGADTFRRPMGRSSLFAAAASRV